jgi:hypothetical protein
MYHGDIFNIDLMYRQDTIRNGKWEMGAYKGGAAAKGAFTQLIRRYIALIY